MRRAASKSVAIWASWNCTALKLGDGFAELMALFHVGGGSLERARSHPDHLRANPDPAFVQRLDRDLVALPDRPEHVFLGHAAPIEDQLGGARRPDAQLVLLLADREAGEVPLDQERR